VSLTDFDLKGGKRSGLRSTNNKFSKLGMEFRILERGQLRAGIQGLHQISDAWLETRKADEKGFCLGFFSEAYLCRSRCAVVMQGDAILAFANLWETDGKEEMSIDLMRYTPDAPGGTMEYLFIRLMLWGKEQGYHWFNVRT
jgi:phosphatidylglycerol lysyltransferase